MDTTSDLTSSKESGDGCAIGAEDTGLGVDLETTHGVVKDGGHEGDVENVVHLPLAWLEELFAEWILLGLDDVVVVPEGLLELSRADTNVLGESGTILIALHETTANVVLAVPLNLLGSITVEDELDWVLDTGRLINAERDERYGTHLAPLFPDFSSDVVAVLQFINESLALAVEQETTDTAKGFGSKELDLGSRLVGVDQTGRVHLDLLHVDGASTDGDSNLVSITGTVIAICGGKLPVLGAVLLQQGVFSEVGSITAGGQDNRAIDGLGLSTNGVLNTDYGSTILDELGDASLFLDDDALGVADCKVLKALHLSVRNNLRERLASVTEMTMGRHRPGRLPCQGIGRHHGGFVVDCDHRVGQPWKGRV